MGDVLAPAWSAYPEIASGLEMVEAYLEDQLSQGGSLISDAIMSLLRAGGKRIRPALVLASGMFGESRIQGLVPVAAAIEIVHMATLMHDDIIDDADTRRGIPTVHARYGRDVAVFAGDYLFTRAFRILSSCVTMDMLKAVAASVQEICEGEVEQYERRLDTRVSFGKYLGRIRRKTAALFALSCYAGAYGAGSPNGTADTLRRFGLHLGMAFQIADDILDFSTSSEAAGKPVLHDVACGVFTLPVIYALQSGPLADRLKTLLAGLGAGQAADPAEIVQIIRESGALHRASRVSDRYAARARRCLTSLPDGPGRRVMGEILDSAVHRDR